MLAFKTFLKHWGWRNFVSTRRALPADARQRLAQRIKTSEQHHTGEIRVYLEAALPASYCRRLNQKNTLKAVIRQRAVAMFSKLGVWDTEHNHGVLIYLQLAERAIEIVADRGIARHVSPQDWQALVARMGAAFRAGSLEDGLTLALDQISVFLTEHFPSQPGDTNTNELPNEPVLG